MPSEMTAYLDDNGEFTMFSLIDQTVEEDNEDECWITDQVPAPDTVLTCEQTVEVQFEYTCDGTSYQWARFDLHIEDITPPEIDIIVDSTGDMDETFGGIPYTLTPDTVTADVLAIDACDANPTIDEFLLNGDPYTPGDPITDPGLYNLTVKASDAAGNDSIQTATFEILERPNYSAEIAIEDTLCTYDSEGKVESVAVTALVASNDFFPDEMMLSSVRMLMLDETGQPLYMQGIPIDGAIPEEGSGLAHETVEAQLRGDCYVRMKFAADFSGDPLDACPDRFVIFGSGLVLDQVAFQWGGYALNQVDPNPVDAVMANIDNGEPCPEELSDVDPEPAADCTELPFTLPGQPGVCRGRASASGWFYTTREARTLVAAPKSVNGFSLAEVGVTNVLGAPALATSTCDEASQIQTEVLALVGDCCDCEITVDAAMGSMQATAQYKALAAWPNYGGHAEVEGELFLAVGCASDTRSVQAVAGAPAANQVDNDSSQPISLSCVIQACSASVAYKTEGRVDTDAGLADVGEVDARADLTTIGGAFANFDAEYTTGCTNHPEPE